MATLISGKQKSQGINQTKQNEIKLVSKGNTKTSKKRKQSNILNQVSKQTNMHTTKQRQAKKKTLLLLLC